MKNQICYLGLIILSIGMLTCNNSGKSSIADNESVYMIAKAPNTGVEGGGCKVVSGLNKGKKGKYDDEGDCCGDWGCTSCGGSNEGKCKDATSISISNELISNNLNVVAGNYTDSNGNFLQCVNLVNDSTNTVVKTICFPLVIDEIISLQNSTNENDKIIGNSIIPFFDKIYTK